MVAPPRIELGTQGFSVLCSTDWAKEPPLDDSTLDAAVFSMSLMGNNLEDYIEEAYRTLRLGGQLLIWNTGDEEANSSLYDLIQDRGFNVNDAEEVYKFYRILAIKQAR